MIAFDQYLKSGGYNVWFTVGDQSVLVMPYKPEDACTTLGFYHENEAVANARRCWRDYRNIQQATVTGPSGPRILWAKNPDYEAIPQGYYAVNGKRYHVSTPVKGKWAGFRFVATGSDYHNRKNVAVILPGGKMSRKTSDHGKQVAKAIATDPLAAMKAYGKITGTCGRCGRKLEDETSRSLGIGPVCIGKM